MILLLTAAVMLTTLFAMAATAPQGFQDHERGFVFGERQVRTSQPANDNPDVIFDDLGVGGF